MKLKETDLGAFEAFPGENGQVYYHDENHGKSENQISKIANTKKFTVSFNQTLE